MRLDQEFIRLPLHFDAERLAAEVAVVPEDAWRPHPQGYPGNSALALIAVDGDPANDETIGAMRATPHLDRMPYFRQLLASFRTVWGRTRLMRLDGNAEAKPHADTHHYWQEHVRVHVPVVTTPGVEFRCGAESTHMAAGECWIFNTWLTHHVLNPDETRRIHLVADTVGSAHFWSLVDRPGDDIQAVKFDSSTDPEVICESFNQPVVMTPWEQQQRIDQIMEGPDVPGKAAQRSALTTELRALSRDWRALWAQYGPTQNGWPHYEQRLQQATAVVESFRGQLEADNGYDVAEMILQTALRPALHHKTASPRLRPPPIRRRFERPIFIVSPPRSGSTLFFETLSKSPSLWTIGGESHGVMESIAALHPAAHGWHSNRLSSAEATPELVAQLEESFHRQLRDRDGAAPSADGAPLRLLEKTPKNSLRVPFLASAFPDAFFIYLYRDMRDTISSMLDAWRSGRFVTYPQLPEWDGAPWSLLLTPGWRDLSGKSLAEIVASQWSSATRYLLDDLQQLPAERWCVAGYDALTSDPQSEIERICRFIGVEWDRPLDGPLPLSRSTLTTPDREKWRRNADDLAIALPLVAEVAHRSRAQFAQPPAPEPLLLPVKRAASPMTASLDASQSSDFRSVSTSRLPFLLQEIGASLLLSTYQSGRIVSVRADSNGLNTHFRAFRSPMGIAVKDHRLVIGAQNHVWAFQNSPQTAARLEPKGRFDACFLPRASHVTGDIRIHEIAFAQNDLWIVNTRFSALCVLDASYSFVPRWKPPFITALAPEDRCHLNGLCVISDRLAYVTALGETDTAGGWRSNKGSGGIVIDVATSEIVARGLSMPHSPRWHDGRLWILESGQGRLSTLDAATGQTTVVAELPGFTRGLAFAGPYAFVGLSQIRESVFDGLPIARLEKRYCGIWVVDTRSGAVVAFLRFEGAVQEVFDIQLLHGIQYPEIIEPDAELVSASFVVPKEIRA